MDQTIDINPDDLTFAMFVLPPVIAVINRKQWSHEVRALVALAVCLLYTLIITLLRQDITVDTWRDTVLQVLVGAFGAYQLFWKPSHIAPTIEAATTPQRRPEYRWEGDVTGSGDRPASPEPDDEAGP